jgi:tRNA acetyltransferase TAN1
MTPLKMNVDCLLYVKTQPPVDPVAFVRRICEDARRCGDLPGLMRCRYVNRLTPVSVMGKASENGLVEVAREALKEWFDLGGKQEVEGKAKSTVEGESASDGDGKKDAAEADSEAPVSEEAGSEKKPFTVSYILVLHILHSLRLTPAQFAIRPTIRNHSNLKRDVVINTVAGLINNDLHKVNLTLPDKVILIDIYQVSTEVHSPSTATERTSNSRQSVCGMSVVDGDWDELKRYNLTELYTQGRNANAQTTEA